MEFSVVATCPLCRALNQCALSKQGGDIARCWCNVVAIDSKILDGLLDKAIVKACVCQKCVEAS